MNGSKWGELLLNPSWQRRFKKVVTSDTTTCPVIGQLNLLLSSNEGMHSATYLRDFPDQYFEEREDVLSLEIAIRPCPTSG